MTEIFPNNIAKIRNKKGITQAELAKRLNIHISHMNKMERHKKPITTTMAVRIANELGCTLNDIFFK